MNLKSCNSQWGLCKKSSYDKRVIVFFAILTGLALLSGVLVILLIEGIVLRTVLIFVLSGVVSVSLRSVVAELIQYHRKKKTNSHCSTEIGEQKVTNS